MNDLVFALVAFLPSAEDSRVLFTEVAVSAGIGHDQADEDQFSGFEYCAMTGGAAAGDYDGDGWVDLFVTRLDDLDVLYRNLGCDENGLHLGFTDVTATAFGSELVVEASNGAAWGDVDEDHDLDLYVTSLFTTSYRLFVNDGSGRFQEEGAERNADLGDGTLHYGWSVSFGDYDRDGYLDLYVSEWNNPFVALGSNSHSRLLHNLGAAAPGYFEDSTDSAGVSIDAFVGQGAGGDPMPGVYSFAPRFADLDGDLWPELVIAGDFGTSQLFWNNGDGTFALGTSAAGVGTEENGMGLAIGDVDGNGHQDLFVTSIFDPQMSCLLNACNWGWTGNRLFLNTGRRTFVDQTDVADVRNGGWGWGTSAFDCDNDGDLDLVMTNGVDFSTTVFEDAYNSDPMKLWRNDGWGSPYALLGAESGIDDTGSGKGLLTLDYDRDGDLDVFVVNNADVPRLFRNETNGRSNWVRFRLVGRHSNSYSIGARISVIAIPGSAPQVREVTASTNFLGQDEPVAHFGLGSYFGPILRVRVDWPSGLTSTYRGLPSGRVHRLLEPQG